MCEICHSNPHNVSCPYSDVSATVSCDICGRHYIKSDVICYIIDGNIVCENCITGYVRGLCNEDEPTATTCDICGQVITEDDVYYSVEGNDVCENCIEGYVSECSCQA